MARPFEHMLVYFEDDIFKVGYMYGITFQPLGGFKGGRLNLAIEMANSFAKKRHGRELSNPIPVCLSNNVQNISIVDLERLAIQ